MTRDHPLWSLLCAVLLAVGLVWLVQLSLPSTQTVVSSNKNAKIIAIHAQFSKDKALNDHIPSSLGQPTTLPIYPPLDIRHGWVHVRLQASGPVWLEVAPPRLTLVRLHYPGRDGQWRTQDNGSAVPVTQREMKVPLLVFALDLPPGNEHEVWVEFLSQTHIGLSVILHQADAFLPTLTQRLTADVAALSALAVLGVMAFGVSLIVRDLTLWLLGWRALFVGGLTLQQTGLSSSLLPAAWVEPVATSTLVFALLSQMAVVASNWAYLRDCAMPLWANRVYVALFSLTALMLTLHIADVLNVVIVTVVIVSANLLGGLFSLGISAWLVWRRQKLALVVVVTSLLALLLYLPLALLLFGLLPQDQVVQQLVFPLPTAVMLMLLFTGAVIQLQRKRRVALQEAMEAQAQQIIWLEQRVAERTAELQSAKNLAEQLNAAKSVFLAKVSHELRAPMHTILGYADLAVMESLTTRMRHLLNVVQGAGRQLKTQIEDLLDFARLERAQLRLLTEVVAINDLHQTVVELALLQATESANVFENQLDTHLADTCVMTDSRRIEQVLMILLINAFRYTQAGQVSLRTEKVGETDDVLQVRFSVQDTGRGIAPDALTRIFAAFERGDTVDSEGLGLGLSIAQPLLALMHSHLEVDSQLGAGSTFSFVLALPRMGGPVVHKSAASEKTGMAISRHDLDWAQLARIGQDADLTALAVWQQGAVELVPELDRLIWTLDFDGIAAYAEARLVPR
jgi:signal transduction histidine kinase